ncbi:SH3 domain protein [Necator americanus]|uniref:SH3 domain protein n=1 Tax=Necator americanus TaxID=51031 RepID=W2TY64_NECAM|nr:SH3 domain protein [Necator americanus]ETN85962.1 SH3 domain protein [Necator americanus]
MRVRFQLMQTLLQLHPRLVDFQPATGTGKSFDISDVGTKQARVILDYDAVLPQEMSVLIVYRLPGLDPDYVMAEKGGVRGRVPISFLELI